METIRKYVIFLNPGNDIVHNGIRLGTPEMLRADFPDAAIIPADEVPANWQEMSVQNGQLVPASAEVLAARRQAETIRQTEFVRSAREARYRTETDTLLFDAMEAYAKKHPEETLFSEWLTAKERIRQTVPNPNASSHE